MLNDANVKILAYYMESDIVGYILVRKLEEQICLLDGLYVLKEYRNKGIAKELWNKAIEECKNYGVKYIDINVMKQNNVVRYIYNNLDFYAIIDNDKLIGMCYIVNCGNAYYLMYLAVEHSLRNQNYGSQILMNLKEKYKTLFLSVDEPIDDISIRRKKFYLRNGFYDTNKFYEDTGVNYEILCTNNEYEITDDNMKMRYINMTNNPKLFEVISNTFNVDVVNLKNKKIYPK